VIPKPAAAFSALAAAFLTARHYERQERRKEQQDKQKIASLLAADISTFNDQLLALLNGTRLTTDPTKRLHVDPNRMLEILPAQTTYEQLVSRIADLHQDAVSSISQFYAQMRRSRAICTAGPISPIHLGYIVKRMSKALLDLSDIVPLSPRVVDCANRIFSRLQTDDFQSQLWNPAVPTRPYGRRFTDETGGQIRRWAEMASANPYSKDEEDDWA